MFSLPHRPLLVTASISLIVYATACTTTLATDYEGIVVVSYIWQVEYTSNQGGAGDRPPRLERFSSTSLINRNGQRPETAVTGPDEMGLWYPALPPKPTVDELEARQQADERFGTPQLIKEAKYTLTFTKGGERLTLPTNYSVYRQVAKAYPNKAPLQLTLGVNDSTVEKAEP